MSHKLWHPLQRVFMCECGHMFGTKTTREYVFVRQQRVCLRAMYTTVRVFQALNKMICGFFPPVSSKWVLAFG